MEDDEQGFGIPKVGNDYEEQNTIDLSQVDPTIIERASEELKTEDNEAKADLEGRIDDHKKKSDERNKPQYDNASEQVKSLIRTRNIELETNLAHLMVKEKEKLVGEQYKGLKFLLKYVGWKAKDIDKEVVLNNVVDNLIYATESTYERKKNAKLQRLKELKTAQTELREYNSDVQESYRLRNDIKSRRQYLQEQITEAFGKVKEDRKKTDQPGYDKSVDTVIKNREKVMAEYEAEHENLGYELAQIEEDLVTNDQRIEDLEVEVQEANVHYQVALSAERNVKRKNDKLQRYKKKGSERIGLLEFYEDLAQDEVLGKDVDAVILGNSGLMSEILDMYNQRTRTDTPSGPSSKMKDYLDHVNTKREETLDKLERKLEQRYTRLVQG